MSLKPAAQSASSAFLRLKPPDGRLTVKALVAAKACSETVRRGPGAARRGPGAAACASFSELRETSLVGLVVGRSRDSTRVSLPELAEVGEHVRVAQGVTVLARGRWDAVLIVLEDSRAALAVSALARLAVDDVVAFLAQVCVEF